MHIYAYVYVSHDSIASERVKAVFFIDIYTYSSGYVSAIPIYIYT